MFGRASYLAWAIEHYRKATFDLATSGIPPAPWSELGSPATAIDDLASYGALRPAIARYNDVAPGEVMPALGASHAIFLAYAALTSPGDEILVESPGYEPLTLAAEGIGVKVRTFERRVADDFRIIPERVAAQITPRTRAIVLTNLHNPTGVRTDDATLVELAAVAAARGAYVIVNELYAPFDDLLVGGIFPGSARKLAPNVVAIGSLTKCFGLGQHRFGWVLAPEDVVERAEAASMATIGFNVPLTNAAYAIAAFGALDRLATRAKALAAGKREIATRWAATLPERAHWSAPKEGLFGMVTLPGAGDLRPRIEAHAEKAGVIVAAGSFFGAPESFRLGWATCDPARFTEGLDRLTSLVAS